MNWPKYGITCILVLLVFVRCTKQDIEKTPVAAFNVDTTIIFEMQTVNFQDESENMPFIWKWNFGDGKTSDVQNPSHTYDSVGIFTVSLMVINCKCADTETKTDYITVKTIKTDSISDYDGNRYPTVRIGDQIWMAENLKSTKFNDGTSIPLVEGKTDWSNLKTPGYCWYADDYLKNNKTYGALYNWYAVETGKLCPSGWHVSTSSDWGKLSSYINNDGGKLKEKGFAHWLSPNIGASNETRFTALPGGYRNYDGTYTGIWTYGYWWCSSPDISNSAFYRRLTSLNGNIHLDSYFKQSGFSVRCLKD